ncbi:YceD family protein [Oceanicoccus sagamiensis]|uniref:Large ribosomal RNA subunit accumulation protein YceD n=1 Tax=Oceanicoccus sagamiensis TaxID=716816 RepID=A0A1X9NNZ1_9GAMM|nr:YceD family protein [Oceanicoccus sagamiensis]ARN76457.1 hypothetical protein BST96_16305 [Oceanicoccus sagamiensis]
MLTAPLPSQIDIRKLVVKGAEISANPPISSLPRIEDLLAEGDSGKDSEIAVKLEFYIDDERKRRVDGKITGTVNMTCQRCLEPMPVPIDVQFELGIVWSEEDAERLPKTLEPLIVGEELVDLADIVSEELILSLPYVNYHPAADCKQDVGYSSVDPEAAEAVAKADADNEKDNPFHVLEQLKFDK